MKQDRGVTMGRIRRRGFTKEFKLETLRRVLEDKETYSKVARDIGVDRSMLYKWKEAFEADGVLAFPGKGNLTPHELALWELRRELEKTKRERDILKKALTYFASRADGDFNS